MSFSRGEVVLLPIPFTDLTSRKVRPGVVIGHSSHPGDLFVVPISSVLPFAFTALQPLVSIGPVMVFSRQARRIISGIGCSARWGRRAEWVFRRTMSLCGPSRASNPKADRRHLACLTLSLEQ